MVKFGETVIAKEKFYAAKKSIKVSDANVDNIVISKFNFKYLIGYLDKDIRPLVLIMPNRSAYVKKFRAENKICKLMSFRLADKQLLPKYKAIWANIKDLKKY